MGTRRPVLPLSHHCRLEQLAQLGSAPLGRLCDALLAAALSGLEHYAELGDFTQPAARRLAFRELGLAIGLRGIAWLLKSRDSKSGILEALRRHALLGTQIVDFWMEPEHRANAPWNEHQDINDAMLATALAPDGYLLAPTRRADLSRLALKAMLGGLLATCMVACVAGMLL